MDDRCADYSIFSWNGRGLNNPAKQEEVRQVVQIQKPLLVCLQETKISDFSRPLITACLGSDYSSNFWFLPADDTRGGVLLACRDVGFQFSNVMILTFTVSVTVRDYRTQAPWTLTGVYGPQADLDRTVGFMIKTSKQGNQVWCCINYSFLICIALSIYRSDYMRIYL
jgi:exonuclease III